MGVNLLERGDVGVAHEAGGDHEQLTRRELMHADAIINRRDIELHAIELIANKSQNPNYTKDVEFYKNDARTALFEALTASGHLSVVESERASLDEIHKIMLGVLISGWSDNLPEFEKRRRFQEICEELTTQEFEKKVARDELPKDMQIATVSDYLTTTSEKQAITLGYRPYNKKGMVRSVKLVDHGDGTYTRLTEQVSRSNADAYETEKFFAIQKIPTRNGSTADVRVLGTQTIYSELDIAEGVVGLMRRLDRFSGDNIRYGEVINDSQIDYSQLREESARRENEAECYIEKLAEYTKLLDNKLHSGEINSVQHNELLQKEILNILRAICTMRPDYAKDCFGEDAHKTYEAAAQMAACGDVIGAAGHIESNSNLEKTVTLCGMSISKKEAAQKGVQADDLATLLKYGMEKFKTRTGRCRVPECPSPKPTEVGPCDVCMIYCQPRFDKGHNISKIVRSYRAIKKIAKSAIKKSTSNIFWPFSFNKSSKHENIK